MSWNEIFFGGMTPSYMSKCLQGHLPLSMDIFIKPKELFTEALVTTDYDFPAGG